MARPSWSPPPDDALREGLAASDAEALEDRIARWRFILTEFGPPAHMLLVGGVPAMFAINELKHSFLYGNYLATIVVAQVFVEHTLGATFAMAGDDKTANAGCARLIDESVKRGWLDAAIGTRLHELRKMRNPYTHSRSGVADTYMSRLRNSATYDPHELAEEDAREAIRIIVDWLRDGSPDWAPATENVSWPDDPDPAI